MTEIIDFDYDLNEIVHMDSFGSLTLAGALRRMPDRVGRYSVLYRSVDERPTFFNSKQIQALLDKHRSKLRVGHSLGDRDADEFDFR
jgi:hypothetical protein